MVKIDQHNEDGQCMVNFYLPVLNARACIYEVMCYKVCLNFSQLENLLFIFTLAQINLDTRYILNEFERKI